MPGRGRVYARTWYELTAAVPLTAEEKAGDGKNGVRLALDVGKQRINLYGKGSMLGAGCDKITTYYPLTLPFGLRLPVTLAVEKTTQWDTQAAQRAQDQAKLEGQTQLLRQLEALLAEGGTVTSTRFSAARQGDVLLVTLTAECAEQIGVSVAVDVA